MRLLLFKANLFMQDDLHDTLLQAGYEVDPVTYIFTDHKKDDFFANKFRRRLKKIKYDAVLSFNYYPILSDLCNENKIPYISWIYDSPIPFFERFDTPYNHIWHFDRIETEEYVEKGYSQIKYLPLAVNITRLDRQLSPLDSMPEYIHDISFVGSLYGKRSIRTRNFVSPDFFQGVLEGYAAAQTQFFNTDIVDDLLKHSPYVDSAVFSDDFPWNYLVRSVHEEATHQERIRIVRKLSKFFSMDLYTFEPFQEKDFLHVHPAVGYYTEMPQIFRNSKINLNMNYRTIRSGISARLFDIMGCGGFVMTTPQPEMFELFEPDRDFVAFYSTEDLIDKCAYYLEHEEERHQIAKNGYEKVKKFHAYENRFPTLFSFLES